MLHMTHMGYHAGLTLCGIRVAQRTPGDIFTHHVYVDENKLTGHKDCDGRNHDLCLACRDVLVAEPV